MSILAEQSLIGCLLLDRESIAEVYGTVKADMFTVDLLSSIYTEYLRAYDTNQDINMVTLESKLISPIYSKNTILETLRECMGTVVTSTEIKSFGKVIVCEWKKAEVEKLIANKTFKSSNINAEIGELIGALEMLQETRESELHTLSEIVAEYKDNYFKLHTTPRVLTGFNKLDAALYLEGGDVTIIGARPSVGKSALATQMALNMASIGKRVALYNLEMLDKQLYERFLVKVSGIPLGRIKQADHFIGDEKLKYDRANEQLCKYKNLYISTGSRTVSEIRHECKHMDYDVIIIDYLQLIKSEKSNTNRAVEVGEISKAIKRLAMELSIPIIVLSQLNRISESKLSKEPTMSELRESGDLEQDASNIILMWNLDDQKFYKGLKIEKNRQGELLKQVMEFRGSKMLFTESDKSIDDVMKKESISFAESDNPFDTD